MADAYLLTQTARLLDACVCIYQTETREIHGMDGRNTIYKLSQTQDEELRKMIKPGETRLPELRQLEGQAFLAYFSISAGQILLAGPVVPEPVETELLARIRKGNRFWESAGLLIRARNLEMFVTGVLLLFYELTGERVSPGSFWQHNQSRYPQIEDIECRMSGDVFDQMEHGQIHNPFSQEMREQASIKNGDLEALEQSFEETYEGKVGTLARTPLRHYKNVAIGNITLASRSAILGGLSAEQSFTMADSFILQLEEMESVPEVTLLNREAERLYTQAVHACKKTADKVEHPLVKKTKNYIFTHLHGTILITEIAAYLNVNADYLSHLFSRQEKITLKRYILEEKIRSSCHDLKYTDTPILEIGYYFGFSSQSHFTRAFREVMGMTPSQYRRQFGDENRQKRGK